MVVSIAGVRTDNIEYGGTRKFAQFVQCGYCDEEERFIPKGAAFPPEALKKMCIQKGWKWVGSGKHACPKCLGKFKAIAMKKDNAPREMTPADKRNIFREIDANYDDKNSRYIGDATDNEIAKKLGVPRKWVENVRDSDFGPSGRNEEMDKVSSAIGMLASDATRAADQAMEAAAAAEKVKLEAETLKKRLDALEASVGPRAVSA